MRTFRLLFVASIASSCAVWLACSSSSSPPPNKGTSNDAGNPGSDSGPGASFATSNPCTDALQAVYGDPGTLPADKGDIIKCSQGTALSASDIQTRLNADLSDDGLPATDTGYTGAPITSGANVYYVSYRTERGDTAGSPGYSSAKILIPTVPRASGQLPIIVGGRGSRGQAQACTASLEEDAGYWVNGDYDALSLPVVGLGLPIIIPDLAGYANFGASGNPISGYALAADVAKSTLDGARAMAKLFPSAFNGKVALVGHSQGGHSVFASLYYQPTYAPDVNIVATAAYSPLWINQATWGALFAEAQYYPLATAPSTDAVSVWYHYTHSELLDGPGHGLDLFQDAAAAAVQHFMDNDCWSAGYDGADAASTYPDLQAVAKTVTDLYTPDFINAIEGPAAFGQPCPDDGGLCSTWVARYAADRPHLPTSTPPIFIEYGSEDETIPPNRMACVVQRLDQDSVNYSFCLNPGVGHEGVVRVSASNVVQWLASKTLGEAPPAACAQTFANLLDDAGQTVTCATPPPND